MNEDDPIHYNVTVDGVIYHVLAPTLELRDVHTGASVYVKVQESARVTQADC